LAGTQRGSALSICHNRTGVFALSCAARSASGADTGTTIVELCLGSAGGVSTRGGAGFPVLRLHPLAQIASTIRKAFRFISFGVTHGPGIRRNQISRVKYRAKFVSR
jgi:hypothetical protein